MSFLIRLNIWLSRSAAWIAIGGLIGMMLLVTADALVRQIFNMRIPFTSVMVANYMMLAIAFLPLSLAEMQDRHISVDLLFAHFPDKIRRAIALLVHLAATITAAGLAWKMWTEALRRFQSGTVAVEDGAAMPIWQGYFLLPAGFALLALAYGLRLILGLSGAKEALEPLVSDGEDHVGSEV